MPQSISQVWLHIVFSTKDRYPFLRDPDMRSGAHAYLAGACRQLKCPARIVNGTADHVHILCNLHRTIGVSGLLRGLKEPSSKWIKAKGGMLTRISQTPPAATPDSGVSAALPLLGLLDVLHEYDCGGLRRAPCIHAPLRRLATERFEKCGLKKFRWQAGYAAFSVSPSRLETVHRYIANQEQRHRRLAFKEELLKFLEEYEVAYDERFLWD